MQFQFHSRTFDPTTRLLSYQGQSTRLRPKTARLLNDLIGRPHELRSKDELIEAIWGHTQMDDQALHQIIRNLRQVVADPDCLITHPQQGYQWVWDVRLDSETPTATRAPTAIPVPMWRHAWRPTVVLLILTLATSVYSLKQVVEDLHHAPEHRVLNASVALTPQFQRMQSVMHNRQRGDEAAALATLLEWQRSDSRNIELMIEVAHSHQQLGQLSMAQQAATDALSMAREQSSAGGELLAGLVLSQLQYQQGLTAAALVSVQRSGQLATEMGLTCAIKLTADWQLAIQQRDWTPEAITATMTQVASNMARCSLGLQVSRPLHG